MQQIDKQRKQKLKKNHVRILSAIFWFLFNTDNTEIKQVRITSTSITNSTGNYLPANAFLQNMKQGQLKNCDEYYGLRLKCSSAQRSKIDIAAKRRRMDANNAIRKKLAHEEIL